MLDAHPDLAIPPETGFLSLCDQWSNSAEISARQFLDMIANFPPHAPTWPDFGLEKNFLLEKLNSSGSFDIASGVREFYRCYARRFGKSRFGDKTPGYCFHVSSIHKLLPEVRFIHLIRDGRDVALSWRKTWFAPGQSMRCLADAWRRHVEAVRKESDAPVLEVRYEKLITDPEPVLQAVCSFIELPFDKRMLDYHRRAASRLAEHRDRGGRDGVVLVTHEQRLAQQALTSSPPSANRVTAWRSEMTPDELVEFEEEAGQLLDALGYRTERP